MKKIVISFISLYFVLCLFCSCSNPNFFLINYSKIHCNGANYNKLEPFGEVQPPTAYKDENGVLVTEEGSPVEVFLVGKDGIVDYSKTYQAHAYSDDPEHIVLFFDSIFWAKEGYHDEWTLPH